MKKLMEVVSAMKLVKTAKAVLFASSFSTIVLSGCSNEKEVVPEIEVSKWDATTSLEGQLETETYLIKDPQTAILESKREQAEKQAAFEASKESMRLSVAESKEQERLEQAEKLEEMEYSLSYYGYLPVDDEFCLDAESFVQIELLDGTKFICNVYSDAKNDKDMSHWTYETILGNGSFSSKQVKNVSSLSDVLTNLHCPYSEYAITKDQLKRVEDVLNGKRKSFQLNASLEEETEILQKLELCKQDEKYQYLFNQDFEKETVVFQNQYIDENTFLFLYINGFFIKGVSFDNCWIETLDSIDKVSLYNVSEQPISGLSTGSHLQSVAINYDYNYEKTDDFSKTVPDLTDLEKLKHLEILFLRGNALNLDSIMNVNYKNLPKLQTVNIQNKDLKELPDFSPTIEFLSFGFETHSFPNLDFSQYDRLYNLDITGPVSSWEGLDKNLHLRTVTLSCYGAPTPITDWEALRASKVENVSLFGYSVPRFSSFPVSLKSLRISYCDVGSYEDLNMYPYLENLTLFLEHNAKVSLEGLSSLKDLYVYGDYDVDLLLSTIPKTDQNTSILEVVSLSSEQNITDKNLEKFPQMDKLRSCYLDNVALNSLDFLRKMPHLNTLEVTNNSDEISQEESKKIQKYVPDCKATIDGLQLEQEKVKVLK